MIHVIARQEILPGGMEKFLKILMDNLPNVLAEEGCIRYEPCFDTGDGPDADKNGKSITHRTVCLMSNDMKRLVVYGDTFA